MIKLERERFVPNFSRHELSCPCCGLDDIELLLVYGLQVLRCELCKIYFEEVFIGVNSGIRCESCDEQLKRKLAKQKGVPYRKSKKVSKHVLKKAADIWGYRKRSYGEPKIIVPPEVIAREAAKIYVFKRGGVGLYKKRGFVHLDVREVTARWGDKWRE